MNAGGLQQSLFVKPDVKLRQKRMAMASQNHVLVTVEAYPHRFTGDTRRQCGQCRGRGGLRFFAAKSPAHARTLDDDFFHGHMQNMRDSRLHLRWMLCGGSNKPRAILSWLRPGCLRFQIKMLLAAEFE